MRFRWLPKWLAPNVMSISEPIQTGLRNRAARD
jgi:hypothetical protein